MTAENRPDQTDTGGVAAHRAMRYSAADIAGALGLPPPTPEQTHIIEHPLTSMLVVAGAGSGKTETMAARVVFLVANGWVEPEAVLGLTFTRKAAGELAERIGRRLRALARTGLWVRDADAGDGSGQDAAISAMVAPGVSTYNAYAGLLVGEHALRVGIEPDATVLGEALAWQLADACVQGYDGPMDHIDKAVATVTAAVLTLSSQLAEHLSSVDALRAYLDHIVATIDAVPLAPRKRTVPAPLRDLAARCRAQSQLLPLVALYRESKRFRSALDFADQVEIAARLALGHPAIARTERHRYQVVLLDEFQDTSEAQMRLLRALFAPRPDLDDPAVPVIAVGDPHQAIYGWRGASATTLTGFPVMFGTDRTSPAAVLPLSTSWRNDERILAAANTIVRPLSEASPVRVERLTPRPMAGEGAVAVGRWLDTADEAQAVADWIAGHWWADERTGERSGATAAVLCRRRSQFAVLVDALTRRGLPVEVVGLGGLLSTPEITDLVALLGAACDATRSDLLMRLLTGGVCRLGPRDIDVLGAWARARSRTSEQTPSLDPSQHDAGGASTRPAEASGLVEAVEDLPPRGWTDSAGRGLTEQARSRLLWLAGAIDQIREASTQPLPDLIVLAERLLGLEVELLARPHATAASARAHLDRFAEVVGAFAAASPQPTPQALLAYLEAAADRERGLEMPVATASGNAVHMLTIHAAKGLEWDVVAVPGMTEGGFPSYPAKASARVAFDAGTQEWKAAAPIDKGWLTDIGALPHPLRGDRGGLPTLELTGLDSAGAEDAVTAFASSGGEHALAEERRLAYVAFTRARRALLASACVWEASAKPRVTSRFLDEVAHGVRSDGRTASSLHWEPMPSGPEAENPAAAGGAVMWPVPRADDRDADADEVRAAMRLLDGGHADSAVAGADDLSSDFEALMTEWRERDRRSDVVAVLPEHLTTSDLVRLQADPEEFAARLRRPMPGAPPDAARAGSRFHAWIEQRLGTDALLLDDGLGDLDDLLAEPAEQVRETPEKRWKANFLASEWAGRTPIEVELTIETVIGGLPVRGRIDAVFTTADGGYEIVDWKSGSRPPAAQRESRDLQLALYRTAYASLRGVDESRIGAAFFYASDGSTVRPVLPGRDELARRIRALLGQ